MKIIPKQNGTVKVGRQSLLVDSRVGAITCKKQFVAETAASYP